MPFRTYQEHGNQVGQKDAVKGSGSADAGHRCSQIPDLVPVQDICVDQRPQRPTHIGDEKDEIMQGSP